MLCADIAKKVPPLDNVNSEDDVQKYWMELLLAMRKYLADNVAGLRLVSRGLSGSQSVVSEIGSERLRLRHWWSPRHLLAVLRSPQPLEQRKRSAVLRERCLTGWLSSRRTAWKGQLGSRRPACACRVRRVVPACLFCLLVQRLHTVMRISC